MNFTELYTIEINRELFLNDSNQEKTTLFIFKKMKVSNIAIITARKGSKRIKNKNLKNFLANQ